MAGPWEQYQEQPEQPKKKGFLERLPGAVKSEIDKIAESIWGAVTLPGDVATGKVDPMSDEGIGRATGLAGIVVGGGTRFPKGRAFEPIPSAPAEATVQFSKPTGAIPKELSPEGEAHVAAFGEQAEQQGMGGARRIAHGMDPQGAMRAGTAEEGGAQMAQGLRAKAETEKKEIGEQFKFSTGDFGGTAKPASIHTDAVMGMPMQMTQELQANRIQLINTPQASAMMKDINTSVNSLVARNKGVPSSGRVTNVNLSAVDQMKQRMDRRRMIAMRSGNRDDIIASQKIMESFDRQVDGWVNSRKFNGDPRAVEAWNVARTRENIYRNKFESSGRSPAGEVVEKILGENPRARGAGQKAADYATGSVGVNPPKYNAQVVVGIRNTLGAESPEWIGVQQSTFMNLVKPAQGAWEPGLAKTRILEFLDGKGKETSLAMYNPQQRAVFRQYAKDVQGTLDIVRRQPGGQEIAGKVMQWGVGMVTKPLGTFSKYVHTGIDNATARQAQTRELADLQKKLPLVKNALQSWFNEIERVQRNNSGRPMVVREARFKATSKLSATLRRLGVADRLGPQQQQKTDKLSTERAFGGPQF